MKREAVDKANVSLTRAYADVASLQSASNLEQFRFAWSDFLVHVNRIYYALEKGIHATPQSRQWYGKKKTQRQTDPLLQYLHQARNADEHGLAPITELHPGGINIGAGAQLNVRNLTLDRFGYMTGDFFGPGISFVPPHLRLVTVIDDRFGKHYDPPTEHLGQPLADTSPIGVARIALTYLAALLREAEARIK